MPRGQDTPVNVTPGHRPRVNQPNVRDIGSPRAVGPGSINQSSSELNCPGAPPPGQSTQCPRHWITPGRRPGVNQPKFLGIELPRGTAPGSINPTSATLDHPGPSARGQSTKVPRN